MYDSTRRDCIYTTGVAKEGTAARRLKSTHACRYREKKKAKQVQLEYAVASLQVKVQQLSKANDEKHELQVSRPQMKAR